MQLITHSEVQRQPASDLIVVLEEQIVADRLVLTIQSIWRTAHGAGYPQQKIGEVGAGVPAGEIELAEDITLLVLVLKDPLVDLDAHPDTVLAADLAHRVLPLVGEILVVVPLVDGLNALNPASLRKRQIGNFVDVGDRAVAGHVRQPGLLDERPAIQRRRVIRIRIK